MKPDKKDIIAPREDVSMPSVEIEWGSFLYTKLIGVILLYIMIINYLNKYTIPRHINILTGTAVLDSEVH